MPSSSKSRHSQSSHSKSKRSHGDERSRKYKYDYYDGNGKKRHRDRDYRESKRRKRHRSSSASSYSSRSSNESYHAYHKRRGAGYSRKSDKYESRHNGRPDPMLNLTPAERKKIEENKKLELEMKRRKERIEKWRTERKKHLGYTDDDGTKSGKKWSLEDDDEEDENDNMMQESENQENDEPVKIEIITQSEASTNKPEGEELDPLDAYMIDIKEEVKKIKQADKLKMSKAPVPTTFEPEPEDEFVPPTQGAKGAKSPSLTSLPGATFPIVKPALVSAAASGSVKNARGELMEQGQDLLEYSSEGEDDLEIEELAKIMSASNTNQSKMDKFITSMDKTYFEYEPFRKEFYKEVPEIAQMTATEVVEYRKNLEDIEIHGKNCPKPIKTWAQAGFSRKILDILKKNNFETPTPIQAQALPAIMSGRDVIGIAKTGSGKTLAFILPMFRQILDQPPLAEGEGPIGLIMTPTRELALQIFKDCRKFAKYLDLSVACVYGGAGISEQIAELKRGAEIVVATPGRMIDMLAANNGKVTNLKRITYCVLDEADRMFDMGFEPQVMRIIENIRPDRQTVLFSATFPRQMEALARRILKKPLEILVGARSTVANTVEQHIFVLEGDDKKYLKLLEILGHFYGSDEDSSSIIVFVEKQERADELLKDLMTSSYSCLSLHGGLDQHDRDSTISDFKAGNVKILIATSVAARGLDVKNLDLVVNFDCPNHYEDYVHRCGRTGRAGKKGFAYTFLTPDQGKMAGEILKALELSKAKNVSSDLRKLWEKYKAERKVEGKEIKAIGPGGGGGGGYGGRGYKFDRVEENLLSEIKKKIQKSVSGFKDSDDEEDDHTMAPDIDQRIDKIFKGEAGVSMQNPTDACVQNLQPDPNTALATSAQLDQARAAASKIAFLGNPIKPGPGSNIPASLLLNPLVAGALAGPDFMQRSTEAFLKGQSLTTSGTIENQRKNMAELLAEKLNAKLNYLPTDGQLYGGGDTGGLRITGSSLDLIANIPHLSKYDDEIEINEFPQQVRWRITSKDTVNYICEYADVGITVKGQYYPPGRNPKLGEDRKLYLAIESSTQYGIQSARAEIKRVIKEEMQKMQTHAPNLARGGRYKLF